MGGDYRRKKNGGFSALISITLCIVYRRPTLFTGKHYVTGLQADKQLFTSNLPVMDGHNNTTSLSHRMSHVVVRFRSICLSLRLEKYLTVTAGSNARQARGTVVGKRCRVIVRVHTQMRQNFWF